MGIFVGVLLVLLVICIIFMIVFKNKKEENKINRKENNSVISKNTDMFPDIKIIEDVNIIPEEKNKIIDGNIKKAIAIFDNYAPRTVMMEKNIENAKEILNNTRAFFSANSKGTEKMLEVKDSLNEVYGIKMKKSNLNNRMIFDKQTKFRREDELIASYGKDALVNAGFNAASMIVGQYYMAEINNKLDVIKNDIKDIYSLLDSEYQGKFMQIISKMKEIIENKVEILNNDYSRDKRYNEVLAMEIKCSNLLGQANEEIRKFINEEEPNFEKYEKDVGKIELWFTRQQILQKLLLEIGNLRYVLANGNETSKLSHTQYNNYILQTNEVNSKLENWNKLNCEKFGINSKEHKRNAKFYKLRKNTIGKINENWAYSKLNSELEQKIDKQINIEKLDPYVNNKQDKEIKILKYKGEYYNLLDDNKNEN